MALGANLSTVNVTGKYIDFEGNPIEGQIRFTLSGVLRNGIDDQIVAPSSIVVPLNQGSFTVTLPATNDPDIVPNPFEYMVEESFPGGRTYSISLPYNTVGTLNLNDISPSPIISEYFSSAVDQTSWNTLVADINVLDGEIDQGSGTISSSVSYQAIDSQYSTYDAIDLAFSSYNVLKSSIYTIDDSYIAPYIVSAQASKDSALVNLSNATNSANAIINTLLFIGG